MEVIFYNVPDSRIKNFEKMPFDEAVKLSQKVEFHCRDERVHFSSEYQVLGDDGKVYYRGTFDFGSYDYPNIYQKIKHMVNRIKVDKEYQAEKIYLLEQIEKLTPDEYKKEEKIDKLLINLDRSQVSKLKKWQRRTIYTIGSIGITGFLMTGFLFFVQKDSYEKALADGRNQLTELENINETYEIAILGDDQEMIKGLESMKKDNLDENQIQILVYSYIENNEFKKAVDLLDDDVKAETMLLTSSMEKEKKIEKIKAFNETYPTNEARYDLAYLEGDWELMLNIENVMMNVKRSEMKTYALLKLGKIEDAKLELNNNSNEELAQKINQYEVITAEIKTLEEKYEILDKDQNADEAKEIEEQLATKKEELLTL